MYRSFVRRNLNSVAIAIFIISFSIVQVIQPSFLYDERGCLRPFGLGRKSKTVLPNWIVAIVLALFSYLLVLYYLAVPKMRF
jgi:hypothetical protein